MKGAKQSCLYIIAFWLIAVSFLRQTAGHVAVQPVPQQADRTTFHRSHAVQSVTWSRAYAHGASPSTRPVVELPVGRVEADQEEWDKFLS